MCISRRNFPHKPFICVFPDDFSIAKCCQGLKSKYHQFRNIRRVVRGEVENPLLETGLDLENEITIMKQLLKAKTIYFTRPAPAGQASKTKQGSC